MVRTCGHGVGVRGSWHRLTPYSLVAAVLTRFAFGASALAANESLDVDRLLDPAHIVDVRIEMTAADWDKMRKPSRDFANFNDASFPYVRANVTIDGVRIESVGIRKKGLFGSLDEEVPSLKLKFDEFANQSPVRGLKRMTLNNNKQDLALVSQRLASLVFTKAGVQAPRVSYARVQLNGKDLGIYSHVESVEKPFLKRRFGDSSGELYEGTLTDFHVKLIHRLDAKSGDAVDERGVVTRIAQLLAAPGELDVEALGQLIDLDNFFRFWAVETLIGWWDGYANNQNNYFAYRNPGNGKVYFMPWGVDAAFIDGQGPFAMFGGGNQSPAVYAQALLTNRLYRAPGMAERYRQTLLQVLDEAWKEDELLAEIDRVEKLLADNLPNRHADWKESLETTREFVRQRRGVLVAALQDWPAKIPDQARTPMYPTEVGQAAGWFEGRWQREAKDDAPRGIASIALQLDGKPLALENVTVVVQPFRFPEFPPPPGGGKNRFRAPPPQQLAQIVISGKRPADDKPVTLTVMLPQDRLTDHSGEPVAVGGSLVIGPPVPGFFGPGMRSISGKLKLVRSGLDDGSDIAGSLDLRVIQMRGGMFNPPPKPDGAAPAKP